MANVRTGSGMIFARTLVAKNVSLDLKFEPSVGLLARRVDKLGADIRSFREPLKRMIKEVMIPSILTNFIVAGRPPWVPLEESTIKSKAKKGQSDYPLQATGRLMRRMGQINIWHIDTEKAMILDLPQDVWYGKVHQAGHGGGGGGTVTMQTAKGPVEVPNLGDSFDGGAIPARPFIMIQEQDIDKMERIMSEWVGERVRKAGLG